MIFLRLVIFLLIAASAWAKPCIPIAIYHAKTPGSQITISDSNLAITISKSTKFLRKNFKFIDFCVISERDYWYNSSAYSNFPKNYTKGVFEYWWFAMQHYFKNYIVTAVIHPVWLEDFAAGAALLRSYLSKTYSPFLIAWCGQNTLNCQIIFTHELLHTIGAKHQPGNNIMNPYLIGKQQLVVYSVTFSQVRRYLKRKGII